MSAKLNSLRRVKSRLNKEKRSISTRHRQAMSPWGRFKGNQSLSQASDKALSLAFFRLCNSQEPLPLERVSYNPFPFQGPTRMSASASDPATRHFSKLPGKGLTLEWGRGARSSLDTVPRSYCDDLYEDLQQRTALRPKAPRGRLPSTSPV